ncbi:MAG: isoprenylcysteine carboxylmethyltransferase family protein [Tissierellia bacterium]|nr:isoprenylcysteine carboxylmethyltransferase family protein [Tissierellia bacterium]
MKRNQEHLPVLGYGPYFIISMVVVTGIFYFSIKSGVFESLYIDSLLLSLLGMVLILLGLIMYTLSLVKSRIGTKIKENKLVTNGIYGYVRNPIYSGFLYVFSGFLLLQKNLIALVPPFLFWIALTLFIKKTEEKWLIRTFGKEYINYMKKVNRCILWFPKK